MKRRKKVQPPDQLGDSLRRTTVRIVSKRLRTAKSQEDAERILRAATDAITKALPKTLAESCVRIADALDRQRPRLLRERRELEEGFERRLHRAWRDGLDRLEALVQAFMEFGEMYYKDGFHPDVKDSSFLFKSLSELHARSCRIAGDILCLMKAGYADGAHARWRTLHEIAVVAQFLAKYGEESAQRYLLHDAVRACRAAERYSMHSDALGFEPIESAELESLRKRRDELIERFGKPFGTDFGWAAEALAEGNPGIGHLESDIGLGHWRPFYGWASDGVHAGPGGLKPTGVEDHGTEYLLAGPSNAALLDPGQQTALSLAQVLSALVDHRKYLGYTAMYMAFNELVKRCQAALVRADRGVKKRTARNLKAKSKAPRKRRS